MKKEEEIFITIDHLDDFERIEFFRVGEKLTLRKDKDNNYDDEAILVYNGHGSKCGYVANSVSTVARGTYSAGRLYNTFEEETECTIRFILVEEGALIAQIN